MNVPFQDLILMSAKNKYDIEILVNNAGYAIPSSFIKTSMEDEEKFLRVLGISVIALSKLFLPSMVKNKKGKIELRIAGNKKNHKIVQEFANLKGYLDLTA